MKPEALRSLVLFRWYFHNTVRKKRGGLQLHSLKTIKMHVFMDMFLKVEINFKNETGDHK